MASAHQFNTAQAGGGSGPMLRPNAPGNKAAAAATTTTTNTATTSTSSPCFCCSNEKLEYLDYDYTKDDIRNNSSTTNSSKNVKLQPYPRIRERGEYYIDTFNDQPWACTFGTGEHVRTKSFIY